MKMKEPMKIFCIGFQKSGTTSLGEAFSALGYRICGVSHELLPSLKLKDYTYLQEIVNQHDVCKDNPWPVLYQQLDDFYPASKFILTLRDESAWIKSVVNHFGKTPSAMLEFIYGVPYPLGHEELFLQTFRKHNSDVINYFKNRPADLLVIDLEDGNNWEKICAFLNIPVPAIPFPHVNKGAYSPIAKIGKYIWKRIRARWRDIRG